MKRDFEPGDRVWMVRPPRGPKAFKFVHQWLGPLRVIEDAGYKNFLVEREDDGENHEQLIAHVSFLATYRQPMVLLDAVAKALEEQLENEDASGRTDEDDETADPVVRASAAPVNTVVPGHSTKRRVTAMAREIASNVDGQYVLEYQLRLMRTGREAGHRDNTNTYERRWLSVAEYDEIFSHRNVVEDLEVDGGV
ncbi:hypothetical protein PHMEG_00017949 [Phytophthora megakarya]|uniref:Uncharacterized protein n=1 Tax=Phytophthora megakarya TaxID=4795 RepID=A0A225VX35_9STRA|nr:hypothetical protein PHMEG_00017949 [Phytophthora megakarya]